MFKLYICEENRGTCRKPNIFFRARMVGTGNVFATGASPDEAIGALCFKYGPLRTRLLDEVVVAQISDQEHLSFLQDDDNQAFALGSTKDEAIGALIRTNEDHFKVSIDCL